MNNRLDVYIWPERDKDPVVADNAAIRRLRTHLILKNQALVNVLRRVPLDPDIAADIELYAYTMEDFWSMEVLGIRPGTNPLLDRIPITPESGSRVHLVLFGSGAQAESLAIHSALVAHYPNYCRDNRLRTRITWVSDSMTDFARFKQQYKGLLENSWRRNVTISGADVEIDASAPKYANERQDFIDVEWEFVEARGSDDIFLYKLARLSNDDKTNFLTFTSTVASREKKKYVFHRDGEFIPITFEGSLGVWLNPKWVPEIEKEDLIKNYKKWNRKHRN